MSYEDFYDIIEYANVCWKACGTYRDMAVCASEMYMSYLNSCQERKVNQPIVSLLTNLLSDYNAGVDVSTGDSNVMIWITKIMEGIANGGC